MAAYDLMPWNSSHGGHERVQHFEVGTAGFLIGEPLVLVTGGTVAEAATLPHGADGGLVGVALAPASYTFRNSSGGAGTGTASTQDFRTRINLAAGWPVPVALFMNGAFFVTENVYDNSDTLVVPTVAYVGDQCGLRLASGVWGVDVGATTDDIIGNVIDVLDAENISLSEPGAGTGAKVVFTIFDNITSQATGFTS